MKEKQLDAGSKVVSSIHIMKLIKRQVRGSIADRIPHDIDLVRCVLILEDLTDHYNEDEQLVLDQEGIFNVGNEEE